MTEFPSAHLRGLAARFEAQRIAFGPVVFQCVRLAWKSGLLARLDHAGKAGATVAELASAGRYSAYAISVILETALSAGVVRREGDHEHGRYSLTRIGDNVLHDELTQVNIDFIHDVCYQGMHALESSLRNEQPLGLKALGSWPTIYRGLAELPDAARASWFAFDHYYSDSSFASALPHVFARTPRTLMDVGANTGKWSLQCLRHDAAVRMLLLDLPGQLAQARQTLESARLADRAEFHPIDLLDYASDFPSGVDAVWMSQFLTCFSVEAIAQILRRAVASLAPGGSLWVLDTFWDRQQFDIAKYCLINTSPYFTALASGNSKMWESGQIIALAAAQGLRLADAVDDLGIAHSLLRFERA